MISSNILVGQEIARGNIVLPEKMALIEAVTRGRLPCREAYFR